MSSPGLGDGPDQGSEQDNPWVQPRFVAAAVIVAFIVILGLVLAFVRSSDPEAAPSPGPSPAVSASSPAVTTAAAGGSVCGLPAGDQAIPVTQPAGARWELVGTIAAPSAPTTYGPGQAEKGLRTCFAHSPTGALFAAINFTAATGDPGLQLAALQNLTAQGPGRDRVIQEVGSSPEESDGRLQVAGFTILNSSPETATIDLAFNTSGPDGTAGLVHFPLTMRWESGDWKTVIPPSGQVYPGLGPLPDLAGYVPWSGA